MKKNTILIIIFTVLFAHSPCSAAWLIQLKDGREVITHKYWEEGDQIKIERYGGVIGISKDDVVSIAEADAEQKARPVVVIKSEPKTDENKTAEEPGEPENKEAQEKKKEEVGNKTIDIDRYKKEKKALLKKRQLALEKYRRASEYGDKISKTEAQSEYKEMNQKLSDLARALRNENGGVLPPWWSKVRLEKEESKVKK